MANQRAFAVTPPPSSSGGIWQGLKQSFQVLKFHLLVLLRRIPKKTAYKQWFCSYLAHQLRSGHDLSQALAHIAEQSPSVFYSAPLQQSISMLYKGYPLHELFTPLMFFDRHEQVLLASLQNEEQLVGLLTTMGEEVMGSQKERNAQFIAYVPFIIALIVIFYLGYFFVNFIYPTKIWSIQMMGKSLPVEVGLFIWFYSGNTFLVFCKMMLAIAVLFLLGRTIWSLPNRRVRDARQWLQLKLPYFSTVLKARLVQQFILPLSYGLSAGFALLDAWTLAMHSVNNKTFSAELTATFNKLKLGLPLKPILTHSKFFGKEDVLMLSSFLVGGMSMNDLNEYLYYKSKVRSKYMHLLTKFLMLSLMFALLAAHYHADRMLKMLDM